MGIKAELEKFDSRYEKEVVEIAAVTGASGVGAGKSGKEVVWSASIELIAWKELGQDSGIEEETVRLEWPEPEIDGRHEKKNRELEANTVVRLQVRKSEQGFLLVSVLDASYRDGELDAILEEALKPVFYEDPVLGTFQLDKRVNTFERPVTWAGEEGTLYIDLDDEEEMKSAMETAHILFKDQESWSKKVREFAAKELVELANDWLEEEDEADIDEITEEMFAKRIGLDTISAYPDGAFDIFYFDDDMFWGHCIIVSGNVDGEMESAEIAG